MALLDNVASIEDAPEVKEEDEILNSWNPIPLSPVLSGNHKRIEPSLLARIDGPALLYRRRVHTFQGPSQSAKTWLAMYATTQIIQRAGRVVYVDFEDGWEEFADRLRDLGVPISDAHERCAYISPEGWHVRAEERLSELLPGSDLLVMDGVTNAMAMMGLDPMDLLDVSRWTRLLRRFARLGCAVVQVDHVTKASEGRGQYAIGSVHKLNAVDGAVFGIEAVKPFGKGLSGSSRVRLHKDRPGALRRFAEGNDLGTLHLDSDPSTEKVTLGLLPPTRTKSDSGQFRPTHLMKMVSLVLESGPKEGLSKNQIETKVKGKATAVRTAVTVLVEEGYLKETKVGPKKLHSLIHPYKGDA
ncbi:AAA family ATPase [Brevibacterium renqingii]|uniref:AAA family ATPase n=1 Tax=Brevibacterium renqingii TaxID=2776916 RepID=UPI001ADEFFEC|nr:AAA family ATPase [Brevibacterium renqingii]